MHIMLSLCADPVDIQVVSALSSRVGDLPLGSSLCMTRMIIALLFCVAAPVFAQSSSSSLNLQLPSSTTSQQTSAVSEPMPTAERYTTTDAAGTNTYTANAPAPYDTTYGDRRDAEEQGCADETFSKPQVHGNVGMGVAASKRASANYETAELDVSKPLGSCDDPKGNVSASIRVTKSNVNFGRRSRP